METPINITKAQASPIVSKTFPDYSGRKFKLVFAEKVWFHDTNWDGGSKNTYEAVRADGTTAKLYVPAPWINPVEGSDIELPVDVLIVEHSVFCGKDCGITIYAHPSHRPKILTAEVS